VSASGEPCDQIHLAGATVVVHDTNGEVYTVLDALGGTYCNLGVAPPGEKDLTFSVVAANGEILAEQQVLFERRSLDP